MATPQVNPNLKPRRRSFFGPILLIAVGVVFLLINQGKITPKAAFLWFADWWPALLIVWGLFKMFDYYQAQREGVPYRGIGAGGWIFLIFLIFAGVTFTGIRKAADRVDPDEWGVVLDDNDIGDLLGGPKFEFQATQEQAFPAGSSLKIAIDRGDITITPGTDDKMHISVKKTIRADNQSEADKVSQTMAPRITVVDKLVSIDDGLSSNRKGGRMDFEIIMPKKGAVDLMTMRGDITVRDREGDVRIHSSRGDLTVETIAGNVDAHMRRGSFSARTVKGDVTLEDRGSDIDVSDVTGMLSVNGEYNSLHMEKIAKGVRFKSSRTDFEVARLDGSITLDLGDMRGNNMTGPLRLDTRSKDIHLDDVSGDLRIQNTNGEVEVTPHAPFGNVDIQNQKGTLRVGVPTGGGYQVDARARRGEVDSDFDLTRSDDRGESRAVGTIGKGGLKLQLSNEYGAIEIRKGALASAPDVPSMPRAPKDMGLDAPGREARQAAEDLKREAKKAAEDAKKQADEIKKEAEKMKKDNNDEQ